MKPSLSWRGNIAAFGQRPLTGALASAPLGLVPYPVNGHSSSPVWGCDRPHPSGGGLAQSLSVGLPRHMGGAGCFAACMSLRSFSSAAAAPGLVRWTGSQRASGLQDQHAMPDLHGLRPLAGAMCQQTRGAKMKVKFTGCKLKIYSTLRVRSRLAQDSHSFVVHVHRSGSPSWDFR